MLGRGEDSNNNGNALPDSAADKDMRLLKDAEQKLYPGCENYTNLSFISKLLHLKKDNRWSDESCTMVLELLKEALPDGESLPSSYSEAERIIRDQGLENMTEDQKSEEVLRRGQAGHMRGHGACPKPTTSTAGQRICTQLKRKKKGIRRHAEAGYEGLAVIGEGQE
ncbi:hypothetical protein L1049_005895 [Liquidambar formosana]|uniref:Uncharacterized protein n=1 Tax=Liquidambar formosana TaxID=63359 RepID=A0AAP0RG56_LIQFO